MTEIIMILAASMLNRLRGSGFHRWLTSKYAVATYMGAVFGLYAQSFYVAFVVAAGFALWAMSGWGEYWDWDEKGSEAEVGWIDRATAALSPGALTDTLQMSLRGMHGYPAFAALAWFHPHALLVGFGLLLQGPIYSLCKLVASDRRGWHALAEALMGALWGALLVGAL